MNQIDPIKLQFERKRYESFEFVNEQTQQNTVKMFVYFNKPFIMRRKSV